MKVPLDHARGMFGPIAVVEGGGSRDLMLNHQLQGGLCLAPGAEVVTDDPDCIGAPGPVSCSKYPMGFLAAAAANPSGHFLMIGLGSGAGPVAVLSEFPGVSIEVVEIDPKIIELSALHFPLVRHFIKEGRLQIHNADAGEFVEDAEPGYDAVLSDGYTGTNEIAVAGHPFYLACKDIAQELWMNIIGLPGEGSMASESYALSAMGWPLKRLWVPAAIDFVDRHDLGRWKRNLIVTTQDVAPNVIDSYDPYENVQTDDPEALENIANMQAAWEHMLQSEIDLEAQVQTH